MKGKKTGGRKKGTPNRDTPQKKAIKAILQQHSIAYITADKEAVDENGGTVMVSQLDLDLARMEPKDRAAVEVRLLEFHTPKMQSTSVDVSLQDTSITIEDRLIRLSQSPE